MLSEKIAEITREIENLRELNAKDHKEQMDVLSQELPTFKRVQGVVRTLEQIYMEER